MVKVKIGGKVLKGRFEFSVNEPKLFHLHQESGCKKVISFIHFSFICKKVDLSFT